MNYTFNDVTEILLDIIKKHAPTPISDMDANLSEYGLDSCNIDQIIESVRLSIGVELPSTVLQEFSSLAQLSGFIQQLANTRLKSELRRNQLRSAGDERNRYKDIILIGPMGVGKSTTGLLLSEKLGVQSICLDTICMYYYYRAGYSEAKANILLKEKGHYLMYPYWKPLEADSVVNMLQDFQHCVFDFGAGQSVYEDEQLFRKIKDALDPYVNVVLLMPSVDNQESIDYLLERDTSKGNTPSEDQILLLKHFIENPSNKNLAKHIVLIKDKSPDAICDEILSVVDL